MFDNYFVISILGTISLLMNNGEICKIKSMFLLNNNTDIKSIAQSLGEKDE